MSKDNLIRDLDILGVQDEVELIFKCPQEEATLSTLVRENEYNACLRYNDSHRTKILSAKIVYKPRYDIQTNAWEFVLFFEVNEIILRFSNRIGIRLIYRQAEQEMVIYMDNLGLVKKKIYHIPPGGEVPLFTFNKDTQIIDSFFKFLELVGYPPFYKTQYDQR